MRSLLAHEWIEPVGGAEQVLRQLQLALGPHDLTCLWNDASDTFPEATESWIARTPARRRKPLALPLMPLAWRSAAGAVDNYDRVVASSHAFAHHLSTRAARRGIPSFAYIHSPARYLYEPQLDRRATKPGARAARNALRRFDRAFVDRRVSYAANSKFVRDRIRRVWDIDAKVIYPPVDVNRLQSYSFMAFEAADESVGPLPEQFVLGASRLVPYKSVDAAITVAERLGLPAVIAGSGPDRRRLEQIAAGATVPVTFVGRVSDEALIDLYRRATLFVFFAVEDFGIMPVEAMAVGTPVLCNAIGGARESVTLVGGGAPVNSLRDLDELDCAIEVALAADMATVRDKVKTFDESMFRSTVKSWVQL